MHKDKNLAEGLVEAWSFFQFFVKHKIGIWIQVCEFSHRHCFWKKYFII